MHEGTDGKILTRRLRGLLLPVALIGVAACSGEGDDGVSPSDPLICDLDQRFLADGGVGRDGIPALTDPSTSPLTDPENLSFIEDSDRVVGFVVDGQAYAVPHPVLWFHEIANFNLDGRQIAVSLCPLTGTSLGFDRASVAGDELRVSGLLFKANLVMFNSGGNREESFWPQMLAEARCKAGIGDELERFPVVEMRWAEWRRLHPNTLTVDRNASSRGSRLGEYPYPANYENPDNPDYLGFPMPSLDGRLPPKERVLGLPPEGSEEALAFPFPALEALEGLFQVVEFAWRSEPAVILWNDAGRGGMAYRPRTSDGQPVTLTAADDGFTDEETGSTWRVDGRAVAGPMAGATLEPIASAYVSFWGAWAAFFPGTEIWDGGAP